MQMNMNALYNVSVCEKLLHPARFLTIYTLSGIAGSLFSFILSPNPGVGASGAIMGVFGALWTTLYENRKVYNESASTVRNSLMQSVVITLGMGLMIPMVDNWYAPLPMANVRHTILPS
jgi:rhomboid protease GluP